MVEEIFLFSISVAYLYKDAAGEMSEKKLDIDFIANNYRDAITATEKWVYNQYDNYIKYIYSEAFIGSVTAGIKIITKPDEMGIIKNRYIRFFEWKCDDYPLSLSEQINLWIQKNKGCDKHPSEVKYVKPHSTLGNEKFDELAESRKLMN